MNEEKKDKKDENAEVVASLLKNVGGLIMIGGIIVVIIVGLTMCLGC